MKDKGGGRWEGERRGERRDVYTFPGHPFEWSPPFRF
jgi:hypothetical protein